MSCYYTSFTHLDKNSQDFGLIITHIGSGYDDGEVDSALSLDPVYRDNYRGTRRTMYGTKYNSVYELAITVVKSNYENFNMQEVRNINRWLTGAQQYSWTDLYIEDNVACRLHGYVKDIKPYKMDSRIIGLVIYMESSSPWCYSPLVKRTIPIQGKMNFTIINNTDDLYSGTPMRIKFTRDVPTVFKFNEEDDILYTAPNVLNYTPSLEIVFADDIDLEYDDWTSVVKMHYEDSKEADINYFSMTNKSLHNLETRVENLLTTETVSLSENMVIESSREDRIFGDDFNFVFPQLKYGDNEILVEGFGDLVIEYYTPMKIVDCIIDTEELE